MYKDKQLRKKAKLSICVFVLVWIMKTSHKSARKHTFLRFSVGCQYGEQRNQGVTIKQEALCPLFLLVQGFLMIVEMVRSAHAGSGLKRYRPCSQ